MKDLFSIRWHPDGAVHMMIKNHQRPPILSASFKTMKAWFSEYLGFIAFCYIQSAIHID